MQEVPSSEDPARRFLWASEVAEFVYCPRAWYYRTHPESWPQGRTPGSPASFRRGRRIHRRIERRHLADQSISPWRNAFAAAAGLLLLGVWFWWTFH